MHIIATTNITLAFLYLTESFKSPHTTFIFIRGKKIPTHPHCRFLSFCRFPQPLLPSLAELPRILADSLPMALVTFAVSASLASIYADKYSYTIDSNQV